ncbi:MAG: SDR family NAD(P)-dependent oxidoreductase [Thalassobaculaceae bacterium]|nr:SDR family NAD(P)-dependent oxidoreductase [Thalassobaculaceae bacterium]
MSSDLPDTVIVTGAASGIGLAIARHLVGSSVTVAGIDVDADGLARACDALGPPFHPFAGDLCDPAAAERLVAAAWDACGPISGLVNAAGIYPVTPLFDMAVAEWDAVLNLNLRAPFLMVQALGRRMADAGIGGSIVNIGSSASTLARPGIAHYGASKAGFSQLTRNLAIELAPLSIRVNAVAPGLIGTERVMAHAEGAGQAEHAAKVARIPLGRAGRPEELVDLVAYLLSQRASYVTGSILFVDGGLTLGIPNY